MVKVIDIPTSQNNEIKNHNSTHARTHKQTRMCKQPLSHLCMNACALRFIPSTLRKKPIMYIFNRKTTFKGVFFICLSKKKKKERDESF